MNENKVSITATHRNKDAEYGKEGKAPAFLNEEEVEGGPVIWEKRKLGRMVDLGDPC